MYNILIILTDLLKSGLISYNIFHSSHTDIYFNVRHTLFVSIIGKIADLISIIIFRNYEDCPFCNCRNSMRIIKTSSGYKKVCSKCKFSIEADDKNDNEKV